VFVEFQGKGFKKYHCKYWKSYKIIEIFWQEKCQALLPLVSKRSMGEKSKWLPSTVIVYIV